MPKVLVPLAQGCEELEAVTIIDLLRRAGIEVITASLDNQPVTASHGVVLGADTSLDKVVDETFDMIALPGGLPGSDHLAGDARLAGMLDRHAAGGQYTAAICAAPKVLAGLGLLDGRQATHYPGALDDSAFPRMRAIDAPVVVDGKVVTGRGPGTAMDFALQLIELLTDRDTRDQTEKALVRS